MPAHGPPSVVSLAPFRLRQPGPPHAHEHQTSAPPPPVAAPRWRAQTHSACTRVRCPCACAAQRLRLRHLKLRRCQSQQSTCRLCFTLSALPPFCAARPCAQPHASGKQHLPYRCKTLAVNPLGCTPVTRSRPSAVDGTTQRDPVCRAHRTHTGACCLPNDSYRAQSCMIPSDSTITPASRTHVSHLSRQHDD